MKKILFGTTALVSALALANIASAQPTSPAAAPLTVTLGGSVQFNAGVTDEDLDTNLRGHGAETDTDAFLHIEGTSDEGLKYGAKAQLLPERNEGEAADEYFIFLGGDWGTVELGEVDGAADRLSTYAPTDFGKGGALGQYTDFINTTNIANGIDTTAGIEDAYKAFDSRQAPKITYFSPRFAGFQFGASFAADGDYSSLGGVNRTDTVGGTTQGLLDRTSFENFYEIGVNYKQEFNALMAELSAGYVGASAKSDVTDYEDVSALAFGARLGYMGFTLGGGYVLNGQSGYASGSANDDDAEAFNVGLQYETGPFIVGANALFSSNEGIQTSSTDNELTTYGVGATYKVAPGLSTFVEATMFDYQSSGGAAQDNEGSTIIFGSRLDF